MSKKNNVHILILKYFIAGTSPAVWLRRHASTARGMSSIPGWGTKIPHAARRGQKRN